MEAKEIEKGREKEKEEKWGLKVWMLSSQPKWRFLSEHERQLLFATFFRYTEKCFHMQRVLIDRLFKLTLKARMLDGFFYYVDVASSV